MDIVIIIIAILSGALVGTLVTALVLQNRYGKIAAQVTVLETQLRTEKEQSALIMQEKDRVHQNALDEKERNYQRSLEEKSRAFQSALDEKERVHQEALRTQQRQFDETMAKVSAQMKVATDEMLKQRQKEFADASNQNLGQIVNPLRETIDQMKQVMAENTEKQTQMGGEMKANIENMMRQSEAAMKSADELNRTFRLGNRVQGDWGETILDELLESQGLKRGIHYDTQPYIRDAVGNIIHTESGSTMRPDVILHLDQRREVIIDSKVSLTAFMDYSNANTEEERKRLLKAHIDSLKSHVRELSTKDYSSYIQPPKARMDYVIMFVPHSAALWTALNAQPDLWRNAMAQNVFIADEQTLFAALRKLAPQGQSILTTCAKLQKLGAKQSDKNPLPQITDIDDIPQLETNDET